MQQQKIAEVILAPGMVPKLPPLVELSPEQVRFMRLHTRTKDAVAKWRLVLGEMYCRAETNCHHATIGIEALGQLILYELMQPIGDFGVDLTDAGWDLLQ